MFAVHYADDPLGQAMRPAVIQEGFDTMCAAPFFDGDNLLGLLCVYHDRPHQWAPDELETIGAFAAQGSVAIKTAQNYAQMATWAAQLQSIQALGTRLNRLGTVEEIGSAIAMELRDLIDYHNVRVYRISDEELIPVAFHGQVGEYSIETGDMLRVPSGPGSPAGSPSTASPRSCPTRRTIRGRRRSRAPTRTSTSRCSSPR